ncbi:MAG: division/cell wall cluster transcriptional repressor MraZ [candidate division WOR-3 bacterium]
MTILYHYLIIFGVKKWEKVGRNNRINPVDEKGRVSFPHDLRKALSPDGNGKIILTRGPEKCIWVFSEREWKNFENAFREKGVGDFKNRTLMRLLLGDAVETEFDNHGRILIPGHLAEYAGIKRECRFVRMFAWIEIWDPARYEETIEKVKEEINYDEYFGNFKF